MINACSASGGRNRVNPGLDDQPLSKLGLLARRLCLPAALIPLTAGYYDNCNYFGPAAEANRGADYRQARYIAALGPEYRAYTLTPLYLFRPFSHPIYGAECCGDSIHNPPALLPRR